MGVTAKTKNNKQICAVALGAIIGEGDECAVVVFVASHPHAHTPVQVTQRSRYTTFAVKKIAIRHTNCKLIITKQNYHDIVRTVNSLV